MPVVELNKHTQFGTVKLSGRKVGVYQPRLGKE